MDTVNNKFFCFYPFRSVDVTADSTIMPCCTFDIDANSGCGTRPKVDSNNSLSDIFNDSHYMKTLRKKMLNNEEVAGCWRCYKKDQQDVRSLRTKSANYLTQTTEISLEYLEIESGRFCNLKCRSCSPWVSSGFHNEIKSSLDMQKHWKLEPDDTLLDPRNQLNKAIQHISKEQSAELKKLKVTGGEPMLSEYFLNYVQNLSEWGFSKNIHLEVFTNSSFLPKQKFLDALKTFKIVELVMSIDAIGDEKCSFLRSGTDWQTMEKVVKYWHSFSQQNKNVELGVSTTLSIFNVLYLKELVDWIQQNINVTFPSISYVNSPKYMSISSLSIVVRRDIAKALKDAWDIDTIKNARVKQMVTDVIHFVENNPYKHTEKAKIMEVNKMFDTVRNENWKIIFPELYTLFCKHLIPYK